MCSIFGVLGAKPCSAGEAFELLAHRGPDSSAFIQSDSYFFGSHRLSIESFHKPHNQPLQQGSYIALFNGEIYNYKALQNRFSLNASDEIETILELFLKFGASFVKELRGMFAIAICNVRSLELWLFRDLVGKKPLYYASVNGAFYFASEPKAIEAQIGFKLNKRTLHQYLGFGTTVAPATLDFHIKKLQPASYLYSDCNRVEIKSFDTILNQKITHYTLESAAKCVQKALSESISLRIPKSLPWGVLLSGGLDSSLVAALAAKGAKQKINLFSIGYDGFSKYDERVHAKEVAKHLGANFYSYNFTKEDFFNTLEELLEFVDDPIGDPAQIPLFFLIKKAKEQGIKVLLSGDGSDELFLGYRTYKEHHMMESVKSLPYANWLKNHLRANFSMNKEWEWYKRALNGDVIFRSSCEIYTDRQLNMLLRLQERDNKNFEALGGYWNHFEQSGRDTIDWYSYCDLKVQLAEFFLVKIDRVSMANGVEVRSPFIDTKVVQSAFSIDPNIRLDKEEPKSVLKHIAQNYLPHSIVYRKKKGLNYPFLKWILEEDGVKTLYEANEKFKIFNEKHLDFLSQKASSGKFKQHFFPLYMLSKWLLKKNRVGV